MTELLLNGSIYVLIGVFAGLMAGILGIGGGIIVVPGLVFIFQLNHLIPQNIVMHVAAGTSLAVMIFTSIAALQAHYRLGEILWGTFNKLWPGIALGTISGAVLAEFIATEWLKLIFAVFLLSVAVKMLMDFKVTHVERFPNNGINRLVSYVIGLKSGLLGVGGGVLIIPYLTYCGVDTRKIAAVSNLCTLTVAIVGTITFVVTGLSDTAAIHNTLGYIYWPAVILVAIPSAIIAPLGAKLNYMLPVQHLKYGFIVILILTALKMLF